MTGEKPLRIPQRLLWISALLFVAACGGGGGGSSSSSDPRLTQQGQFVNNDVYTQPPATGDGWQTADAGVSGLDVGVLTDLVQKTLDGDYNAEHSVLIAVQGQLVLEEYFDGLNLQGNFTDYTRNTLHTQMSVTKSVTSVLIGFSDCQRPIIKGAVDNH